MTKILTKLLCAALLLLCAFNTRAQEIDSLYVDSTDNEFSTVHMLDSVFRNVDLSQVPTGILIDKALLTANITDFNGTLQHTFKIKHSTFFTYFVIINHLAYEKQIPTFTPAYRTY